MNTVQYRPATTLPTPKALALPFNQAQATRSTQQPLAQQTFGRNRLSVLGFLLLLFTSLTSCVSPKQTLPTPTVITNVSSIQPNDSQDFLAKHISLGPNSALQSEPCESSETRIIDNQMVTFKTLRVFGKQGQANHLIITPPDDYSPLANDYYDRIEYDIVTGQSSSPDSLSKVSINLKQFGLTSSANDFLKPVNIVLTQAQQINIIGAKPEDFIEEIIDDPKAVLGEKIKKYTYTGVMDMFGNPILVIYVRQNANDNFAKIAFTQ